MNSLDPRLGLLRGPVVVVLCALALTGAPIAAAATQDLLPVVTLPGSTAEPSGELPGLAGEPSSPPPDTQPPTVAISSPMPGALVSEARPAVAFTYEDASGISQSSVRIRLDGVELSPSAAWTRAAAFPASDLAPGEHTVEASVADAVGNVAHLSWSFRVAEGFSAAPSPALVALVLPGLPSGAVQFAGLAFADGLVRAPVLSALVSTPAMPSQVQPLASFDLAPAAPGAGSATVEFTVDAAWLASENAPAERVILLHHVDGAWEAHALDVMASDAVSVRYRAVVPSFSPFALVVDEVAPQLSVSHVPAALGVGEPLRLVAQASDGVGVVRTLLFVDGAVVASGVADASAQVEGLAPGTHVVVVEASDAAGNAARETHEVVVGALPGGASSGDEDEGAPPPEPAATDAASAPRAMSGAVLGVALAILGAAAIGVALWRKR